jgi:hypothetical protein
MNISDTQENDPDLMILDTTLASRSNPIVISAVQCMHTSKLHANQP